MIFLYLFLVWFIPTLIHIIWWYYDMGKGESIKEFIESIDEDKIIIGLAPVLNIIIIVYFMFFIIDFVYNKIKHWRK